jgi:predicted phosphodiesterase
MGRSRFRKDVKIAHPEPSHKPAAPPRSTYFLFALPWCIVTGVKSRLSQLLVFVTFLLTSYALRAESSTFAIVSDTHVGARNSVYRKFIRRMEDEGISRLIHTGDITHRGSRSQWEEFLRLTGSDKDLHLTPGNHDVRDQASFSAYLDLFHVPYHSFAEGNALFVFLNTELPGKRRRITGEQLKWLTAELERPFQHKFVFLHEPLFPLLPGNGLDRYARARDALHNLFVKKGVSLVVAGHDHVYNRTTRDGIEYVIQGSTGGRMPWFTKNGKSFRYMVTTRTDDGYSFMVKDLSGTVRDAFLVNGDSFRYPVRSVKWGTPVLGRLYRFWIDLPSRKAPLSPS